MRKFAIYIFFCFHTIGSFAQNEVSKWYFGNKAGLDFTTNPATILTTSAMKAPSGCASIADISGNLLFYTKGDTVWNQAHQVMANGWGLFGNSDQSSLIVKQPGNSNIYYLFTQAGTQGPTFPQGLNYSIIDISLAAGMGSVTVKNIPLYAAASKVALSGVRHCNGTDIWIICHEAFSNTFRAFLAGSTGVNTTPVISSTGIVTNFPAGSCIKFSSDGKKLAFVNKSTGPTAYNLELFDFNSATGVLSNSLTVFNGSANFSINGCEFSQDGSKLYASSASGTAPKIYQWDLCAGSANAIVASQYTTIGQPGQGAGWQMQRAPNGKIYVSINGQSVLDVINNPDLAGVACNYIGAGQSIAPNLGLTGLPNFISSSVKPSFNFTASSLCAVVSFTSPIPPLPTNTNCPASNNPVGSILWLFGDPTSGAANTSTLDTPVHNYPGPGTYMVKLIINYNTCAPDTLVKNIVITAQTLQAAISTSLSCANASAAVSVSGGSGNYSYLWSAGLQTGTTVTGLTPGIYTVTVNDLNTLCSATPTIQINSLPSPTISLSGNFTLCPGKAATVTATGGNSYTWTNTGSNANAVIFPAITTVYSVTASHSINVCTATKVFTISVANCTGIAKNQVMENSVQVFPNPSSGLLFVEAKETVALSIYDLLGNTVFETFLEKGKQTIDISELKAGLYFIKTRGAKNLNSFTLVKTD